MTPQHKSYFVPTLLMGCLLLAQPALAEPPRGDRQEASQDKRKEMLEKIRLVRMYSLTEALDLDESTAAKLFPYLRKHDATLEKLQQNKHKSHRALRKMVKDDKFDSKAADRHFAVILDADIEIAKTERIQLDGLKEILSAEQRVKFVLAKPQFERRVRELMHEERQRRRRHRGERRDGSGPPVDGPPPGH